MTAAEWYLKVGVCRNVVVLELQHTCIAFTACGLKVE
jgi:hypothetical protein